MKTLLLIIGVVALIAGLLFAAQGAGIISWPAQSFMVGASHWTTYGLIIAAVGLLLIVMAGRRTS